MAVLSPSLNNIVYASWFAGGSSSGGIVEGLAELAAAGGGKLVLDPSHIYSSSVDITYAIDTGGPIEIEGGGWSTVLSLTGVANKGLWITGVAGVTGPSLILKSFRIVSNTSGISAAGIHLDGLAIVNLRSIWIDGNGKMTTGMRHTATQQGEIAGGYVQSCVDGMWLENTAGSASNGLDIHGVSFTNCSATSMKLDATLRVGELDTMIHHNHFTASPVAIDCINGWANIEANHFELHSDSAIRVRDASGAAGGGGRIICNTFGSAGAAQDIDVVKSGELVIMGNLLNAGVNLRAGCSGQKVVLNRFVLGSTFTDNATATEKWGNSDQGSVILGASFNDDVTFTSRRAAAGDIGLFKANPAVGGAWGMSIVGAGAPGDIYYRFGAAGPALVGTTAGAAGGVQVMDAVGGNLWAKFIAAGSMFKRVFADQGTSHVNGDWALSAGWGVGSTAVVAASSKDNRFRVTITAAGVPAANPTATLTFKDGTFTNAPFAVFGFSGGTGVIAVPPEWTTTATTLVATYVGTPVAGQTYILEGVLLG